MTIQADCRVAVVIPSYRVTKHILSVLAAIGPEVSRIFVVDDCCPDHSGDFVSEKSTDPRVVVLRNESNQGVGGAVMAGYRQTIMELVEVIMRMIPLVNTDEHDKTATAG